MSQIEKYAHVLPGMFYTGCTTTIGAQQAGGTMGPRFRASDGGRRTRVVAGTAQYNTRSSRGGACGWQPGTAVTVLRVAWAKTMMQTADVDSQVRPAGRAARPDRGGEERRCVWEPGPSGRPVESCRRADVTPGTCREGGAAGVTLLWGCLAISCAPACGLDDR